MLAEGSASEPSVPGDVLVLDARDRSTLAASTATVNVAEATPFTFDASGRFDDPDPGIPVSRGAGGEEVLTGPAGELGRTGLDPGSTCHDLGTGDFSCGSAAPPIAWTGTLVPGAYPVSMTLETVGTDKGWPSVGPLGGFGSGELDVARLLDTASPAVPGLGAGPHAWRCVLVSALAMAQLLRRSARRAPEREGTPPCRTSRLR